MKPCRVDGCTRRVRANGLCFGHNRSGVDGAVAPRIPGGIRDELGRKHCRTCDQWLSVDLFTKDFRSKDGRRSLCLSCHSEKRRIAKYGVDKAWFERTFAEQGSCCAICGSDSPRGRGWAIDHDHNCCTDKAGSCGKCVRGILCSPCNLALGLMRDNTDALRNAIAYVERMSLIRGV